MRARLGWRGWVGAAVVLGAGACAQAGALHAPAPRPFHVGVYGDVPYITEESQRAEKTAAYGRLRAALDGSDLAFVVHIGDFAAGGQCADSLYAVRAEEFSESRHPLVYLFGDNEWTDCAAGGFEPIERLERLRGLFAAPGADALGRGRLHLVRQSADPAFAAHSENVRWTRGGVVFLGVHLVGSNNNWGPDSLPSPELQARTRANVAWLRAGFAEAERTGAVGVAVFTQANPLPSTAVRQSGRNGFGPVADELERLAIDFGRPVALVHGDTHYFRVDMPFAEPGTRRVRANITRAETFGDPNTHWLRMTVDPSDPDVFTFRPMVIRANAAGAR